MASELTPVPDDLDLGQTIKGLVISQQVFGRYKLRHVLGRGGMGIVWLAHDERLERDVALKFLPEAVHFDAGALDDLKRETRRCLDLTHPNIIRIYDFVTDQQAAAISMEYIDGKTLAGLRIDKENRVFETEELAPWMAQACQALFYAHDEVKVVHRDLKPANLMLTSRGQVKIADFGIARSVSDSMTAVTMRKATSGTLVYMSPQQMNGDIAKVSDDIYAFGATVYEFLTTKPPFYSGDIPFQVRQSIAPKMSQRREDLGITGAEIPKEWEDTVAACLEKAPHQRPRDMLEVAERLGLPIGTRQTRSAVEPTKKTTTSATTTVTTEKKTEAKAPPVPKIKPPKKPFPTKLVGAICGGLVVLGLAGWALWSFVLWPFIATPGELDVTSDPVGATVHVPGQTDRVTPAIFDKLRIGRYHVTLSQLGYDPVDATVIISEGKTETLSDVHLKRTYGKLSLITEPAHAHYTLVGSDTTADTSKEGTTPDILSNIPAGKYQLTLTVTGIASYSEPIEIPAHDTLVSNIDLVGASISTDASPDPKRVLLGQLDATQLDAQGKTELAGLLNTAFEKYLNFGLLLSASDKITKLKAIGQDTTADEKELAVKRTSTEKEIADHISDLIDDKKFATARAQLDQLNGVLEKESVDRLNAQFAPKLTQYQQQVDAAIKMSQSGPPAAAYDQLKTFAEQYPSDVSVQLALAQLETEMPPDHDKLTAQIKTFKQFAAANKDALFDSNFQAMQDKFANELKQLDELAAALDEAKNGPAGVRSEIASLESQKASAEKRRVGAENADAAAQTVNFFGQVITGHSVVNTAPFFANQQAKDEEIASLQARIDADQQRASQPGDVEQAQRNYDAFVAHVPW
jgi:serine/threonine protein kinase